MRRTILFLVSLIFVFSLYGKSDSTRNTKSIRFFYQAGKVLPTNSFVEGQNEKGSPIDFYESFSLQYGIETHGEKLWQQLYGFPTWGFGFYVVDFFDPSELGTPSAFYAFFNAPLIKRFNKWSLNYDIGFGLTYDWKPFNQETNPMQYAIGSYNTVYIDVGLQAVVPLGKRFELSGGFSFTHFSNGATRVPNMGINLLAPKVGIKYLFNTRKKYIVQEVSKYEDNWEYVAAMAGSIKQLAFRIIDGVDSSWIAQTYNIFTFSTGVNRQISHKVKFGAGADFSYDGAYNSYIEYDSVNNIVTKLNAGDGKKLAIGIYASFELVVNNLSVIAQPGWYVYREDLAVPDEAYGNISIPRNKPGESYQRLGLKYHIFKDVFVGINIRAYDFSIADYIEWNVGYRVRWR